MEGLSHVIEAEVIGGELVLAPDRSADHKALLAALDGVAESAPAATARP